MTKTQANEPGFVLANEAKPDPRIAPLARALEAKRAELIAQPLSFIWNDLAKVALDSARLVPSPAYGGVKALNDLGTPDEWKAKREDLQEWTGSAWLAGETDDDLRPRLYSFLCGLIGWMHCGEDAARALSPVAVEEADAKAGKPTQMAEGCCSAISPCGHQQRDPFTICEVCTRAASTIPSEPEAKGEAGDGPVGEAVAWQWRTRLRGGAWDAWENGKYLSEPPPHLEVERRPLYARPVEPPGEVERLVEETGSSSVDDLRDMALVGHSLMNAIHHATQDGPFKDWTPAEDPAEIVADLVNALAETRERLEKVNEQAVVYAANHARLGIGPDTVRSIVRDYLRAALFTQESSAALAGDGKEAGR